MYIHTRGRGSSEKALRSRSICLSIYLSLSLIYIYIYIYTCIVVAVAAQLLAGAIIATTIRTIIAIIAMLMIDTMMTIGYSLQGGAVGGGCSGLGGIL